MEKETEILQALAEQKDKIEAIYRSVEKTRRYFLATIILSVILFVLPLIGLFFALPSFFSAISGGGLLH